MDISKSVLKTAIGVFLYFFIINTIIAIQYPSIGFAPEQWLLNPLHNLRVFNPLAYVVFLISIIVGWIFLEEK